jgi:hypothetical protein
MGGDFSEAGSAQVNAEADDGGFHARNPCIIVKQALLEAKPTAMVL